MNSYVNSRTRMGFNEAALLLLAAGILGAVVWPQQLAAAVSAVVVNQTDYRWRADDGSETTASWAAAVNTPIGGVNDGDKLRLRMGVTSGSFNPNVAAQLEYSSNASNCSTGTWTAVTAATTWKTYDSPNYAESVATTRQISSPANFIGGYMNDVTNQTPVLTFNAGDGTEYEWAIQANGISAGEKYFFRVKLGASSPGNPSLCAMIMTTEPPVRASISNAVVSGMGVGP